MRYPFLNSIDANSELMPQIEEAVLRVVRSGRYVGGGEVEAFERSLAQHCHVPHVVGVSNGLDALRLIFRGLILQGKLREGDEVIVPANTYIASVLAVIDAGLTPVFAEPSTETLNLDTSRLDEYLTPRTRALLTVHLYGRACYDESLRNFASRHQLILVEDNAQAIGAEAPVAGQSGYAVTGGLGDAAAFSFYPTKNIGAMGDAGAVATCDPELASIVRALANYGSDRRYHNIYVGYNCRLDPIQAAVLSVKLSAIESANGHRARLADIYLDKIDNPELLLPTKPTVGRHVWHQFVLLADDRDRFRDYLTEHEVGTDVHYATPPHRQPSLRQYSGLQLPVTDSIASRCVSLPITASTTEADAAAIARIINAYHG